MILHVRIVYALDHCCTAVQGMAMGHEAGLRIPSSRAGMPLVGAGRLQLAGWWAWGLKATIIHKVRYNAPAPRAHTTGMPAPELRYRSKWHGRLNPLPGAGRIRLNSGACADLKRVG